MANAGDVSHRGGVTQPLALVFYENLLIGNQAINRLQELGYRTTLVTDQGRLVDQARAEKPLVFVAELAAESERVCEAISRLRHHAETNHIPVLAFARRGAGRKQKRFEEMVRGAGVNLLADKSGLLSQLPGLLDQVLAVE